MAWPFNFFRRGPGGGGYSGGRPASLRDVPDHGRLAPPPPPTYREYGVDFSGGYARRTGEAPRGVPQLTPEEQKRAEMTYREMQVMLHQGDARLLRERKLADAGLDPYYRPLKKE